MAPKRKAEKEAPSKEAEKEKKESKQEKKAKTALAIGDLVPDVKLENEEGTEVKLRELFEEKGGVIFMYPKANTGGCTKQACGFKDNYQAITDAGFEVFGMSYDKPKSQGNWKSKYSLPYHLLTDATGEAIKAFGASKGDKKILRSHVVIAKGGKLIDIKNGISPGDSFVEALKTVTEAAAK